MDRSRAKASKWTFGLAMMVGGLVTCSPGWGQTPSSQPSAQSPSRTMENKLEKPSPAPSAAPSGNSSSEESQASSGVPYLGVQMEEVSEELAAQLKNILAPAGGALILRVQPDSPASKAGLQKFDIIKSIDGTMLEGPQDVTRLITAKRVGNSVSIGLVRSGRESTIQVTLTARPTEVSNRGWNRSPDQMSKWNAMESLTVERIGPDKWSLGFKLKDTKGHDLARTFTGDRNQIRQQVLRDPKLTDSSKDLLLDHLNVATFGPPDIFHNGSWMRGLSRELRNLEKSIDLN